MPSYGCPISHVLTCSHIAPAACERRVCYPLHRSHLRAFAFTAMAPTDNLLSYTEISKETFDEILSQYPSAVPDNLRELDAFRYDEIPATVAQRAETEKAYLKKEEVVKLVEWKL